jgi:hypothetical protein
VGKDCDNLTSHGERPSTILDFGMPNAIMKHNVSTDAPSNSISELPISFSFNPGREKKRTRSPEESKTLPLIAKFHCECYFSCSAGLCNCGTMLKGCVLVWGILVDEKKS